jgi:hypothetical protein
VNIYRPQPKIAAAILLSILGVFITFGIGYEIMPNDKPFILYGIGIVRKHIEPFIPTTMQINTVDIKQNYKLIDAISWINKNRAKCKNRRG